MAQRRETASMLRIALVGNYDAKKLAHQAIPKILTLTQTAQRTRDVSWTWVETETIEPADASDRLADFDGIWCTPGSPYTSFLGALSAIRYARENSVPFLGTCGGFQHALIEYARNVLGLHAADHAESNPEADLLLITPLSCSLVEKSDGIALLPGSRIARICSSKEIFETYHCNYGLNPELESRITVGGEMLVCGRDSEGQVRALELTTHPFFFCTLFQPERAGLAGNRHPIIDTFIEASERRAVSMDSLLSEPALGFKSGHTT